MQKALIILSMFCSLSVDAEKLATGNSSQNTSSKSSKELAIECIESLCTGIKRNPESGGATPSAIEEEKKARAETDKRLRPIQQTLIAYINSDLACTKAKTEFLYGGKLSSEMPELSARIGEHARLGKHWLKMMTKDSELGAAPTISDLQKAIADTSAGPEFRAIGELALKAASNRALYSMTLEAYGATTAYRYQYPGLNFQSAARTDMKEALSIIDSAKGADKSAFSTLNLREQIIALQTKYSNGQIIDEAAAATVRELTGRVRWMNFFASPEARRSLTGENERLLWESQLREKAEQATNNSEGQITRSLLAMPTVDPELYEMSVTETLKLYNDLQSAWPTPTFKNKSLGTPTYFSCLSGIASSEDSLATKSQIDGFKSLEPIIRQNVILEFARKICPTAIVEITKFISSQEFFYPPAKDRYLTEAKSLLETLTKRNRACEAAIKSGDVNASWTYVNESNVDFPEYTAGKVCDGLTYAPIRDYTTELGGISVGAEAVKNPILGKGIESHELGHTLNHLFADSNPKLSQCRAKYEQVVKCLSGIHSNYFDEIEKSNKLIKPHTIDLGPMMGGIQTIDNRDKRKRDHYCSEDFADLAAAVANSKENFWCGVFQVYDLTSRLPAEGKTLQNLDSLDVHSANFLRLLNVEVQSGRPLQNQCKQIAERENYQIKKCL